MIDTFISIWSEKNFALKTFEHLNMFGIALLFSMLLGIFFGLLIYRYPRSAHIFFNILNVVETIPGIAFLILLLPLFGLGATPTIVACVIYSILPIARNTYTGLISVDHEYLEIAKGLGLSSQDILLKIRIPLSYPLILAGIRIAIVFTMGVVTLGGLIAAGGIGEIIQTGIATLNIDAILFAALWVGVLAVVFDAIAGMLEHVLKRRYG